MPSTTGSDDNDNDNGSGSLYVPAPLLVPDTSDDAHDTVEYSNTVANSASPSITDTDPERRWAMILFSVTTVLLFADQNLMAPNLTAIAEVCWTHHWLLI
jgi:hypothetical protein